MFNHIQQELETSNWVKILSTRPFPWALSIVSVPDSLYNLHDWGSYKKSKKCLHVPFKPHSLTFSLNYMGLGHI